MIDTTPILKLPYLASNQSQKEEVVNTAFKIIDDKLGPLASSSLLAQAATFKNNLQNLIIGLIYVHSDGSYCVIYSNHEAISKITITKQPELIYTIDNPLIHNILFYNINVVPDIHDFNLYFHRLSQSQIKPTERDLIIYRCNLMLATNVFEIQSHDFELLIIGAVGERLKEDTKKSD